MEHLKNIMQNLPKNIEYLALNLNKNYLGTKTENIQYLGEGLK